VHSVENYGTAVRRSPERLSRYFVIRTSQTRFPLEDSGLRLTGSATLGLVFRESMQLVQEFLNRAVYKVWTFSRQTMGYVRDNFEACPFNPAFEEFSFSSRRN
jgi:hypothetical protein